MNSTKASSSNPSKKIKLTIISPRQLFVNISSDEHVTTTPSPTTTSSSPTPQNAPSKTPSNNDTSTSHDDIPSSFQSKLQILPPSSNEPTSHQPLNPLLNNIFGVPPRPSNPQPLQSHPSLDITLSLSPFENLEPPSPPQPQPPIIEEAYIVLTIYRSYADMRRKPLKLQVRDKVMLKVSPWKWVIRFGKLGKLNPRYIGHFKVIAKVRPVSYRLELPQQLSKVHSMPHVSNLKKCLSDESLVIPLQEVQIDVKLHFIEEPVEIMDR
ncbi:hypothetical protein Tco_1561165 [Tanacetum coccineum]